MKTIKDFKNAMRPGSVWETTLYWTDRGGVLSKQRYWPSRVCAISQSNAFAFEGADPGATQYSWCEYPKKADFHPVDSNTVELHFAGGMLRYTLLSPAPDMMSSYPS